MYVTPFEYFKKCFPNPPKQNSVGKSPAGFIKELEVEGISQSSVRSAIARLELDSSNSLDRQSLRDVCRRASNDNELLVAYACTMAWGNATFRNFRLSIRSPSQEPLIKLLRELRGSSSSREEDFRNAQSVTRKIKGLKISFFSKLLFFFRAGNNAYILDQWTAKSAKLVFEDSSGSLLKLDRGGKRADPETSPETYERYCRDLDELPERLGPGWADARGHDAERALFDPSGGEWRKFVKSWFSSTNPSKKCIQVDQTPTTKPKLFVVKTVRYFALKKCQSKANVGALELDGCLNAKRESDLERLLKEYGPTRFEDSSTGRTKGVAGSRYAGWVDFGSLGSAHEFLQQHFEICGDPIVGT